MLVGSVEEEHGHLRGREGQDHRQAGDVSCDDAFDVILKNNDLAKVEDET